MPSDRFDAPLFIGERHKLAVDLSATPYFVNHGGTPRYEAELPAGVRLRDPVPVDPARAVGHEVRVPGFAGIKQTPPYGVENQLEMDGEEMWFEPLWATRDHAAAFGITLVEPGEAVRLECPQPSLDSVTYDYGVFAGHWSPYQETRDTLVPLVITDLEHHDFPHVFHSTDPAKPLVISVGRYWPGKGVIRLADLWVKRGDALYIPPMPHDPNSPCVDLHNNRNSALACWGEIGQAGVETHTLLQMEGSFTHWYWNGKPTRHGRPAQGV